MAEGLFQTLTQRSLLVVLPESYGVLAIDTESSVCKASTLTAVLSLWLLKRF